MEELGWRTKTPKEVREEYEDLARVREKRRLQQKTNPTSRVEMTINATDLFDRLFYDSLSIMILSKESEYPGPTDPSLVVCINRATSLVKSQQSAVKEYVCICYGSKILSLLLPGLTMGSRWGRRLLCAPPKGRQFAWESLR